MKFIKRFLPTTDPRRRRYGLASIIGLIAGIVSSFVKWGSEFPLPPRSPADMWMEGCAKETLIRAAENIDCSRNFLNPPYVFLRDWIGVADPNAPIYTFAGHIFNFVGFTHIILSILIAVSYCIVVEAIPFFKLWQGLLAGALAQIGIHMITLPLMGLTPPLSELPIYEWISEIVGHLIWFWSIEIIRRDLRNRWTREPDPEIPLNYKFRVTAREAIDESMLGSRYS